AERPTWSSSARVRRPGRSRRTRRWREPVPRTEVTDGAPPERAGPHRIRERPSAAQAVEGSAAAGEDQLPEVLGLVDRDVVAVDEAPEDPLQRRSGDQGRDPEPLGFARLIRP